MPVSHLGLTVSHIPSATSFYLATLAPLGYRYIGRSGESVGLGVTDADFFLTQEPQGKSISPTHIAFAADSRLDVRNCYAAALSAGAYPSGAPSYRDRDCTVFNAAVEDLDGNVVEIVHKELIEAEDDAPTVAAPEQSRVLTWQKEVASNGLQDDIESLSSRTSRARSRAGTIKDLVSSASRSVRSRSEAPTPGLTRARTLPVESGARSDFVGKAMFGTLLGAAAGGALAWAMMKTEGANARDEAAYSERSRSKAGSRRGSLDETSSHRNYSMTESQAAAKSHRNFSTTESAHSRKYPPRSLARSMGRTRRAIEPAPYYNDAEVEEAITRYTSSRRPGPPRRSKTIDAIEYAPISTAGHRSQYTAKRSATLPINEPVGYLEAPRERSSTSRHSTTSHRSKMPPVLDEDEIYDEPAAASKSTLSRHSTTSRRSPRQSATDEDQDLKRRDSGVSMHSYRSHQSRHSRHSAADGSQRSAASTLRPSRRGSSRHDSAAAASPPVSDSRAASYVTAAQVPIPESWDGKGYDLADESDGLGDSKTVVPDDSISCVDFNKPRSSARSHHSYKSSRNSSKRSEAAGSDRTLRPAKREGSRHSAATLPVRARDDHYGGGGKKRSTVSYA